MSATPIDNSVPAKQHPTDAEQLAIQLAEQNAEEAAEEAARQLNATIIYEKFEAAAAKVRAQKREGWEEYGLGKLYDCYQ